MTRKKAIRAVIAAEKSGSKKAMRAARAEWRKLATPPHLLG